MRWLVCLWLGLAALAWANPSQRIVLTWDSRDDASVELDLHLVSALKKARANGHFAHVSGLDSKVERYDFAAAAHQAALKKLGLTRAHHCPYLALAALDKRGYAARILWGLKVADVEAAMAALDNHLGLAHVASQPPVAAPLEPSPSPSQDLMSWGVRLFRQGELGKADEVLEQVLTTDPRNANALWELARCRLARHKGGWERRLSQAAKIFEAEGQPKQAEKVRLFSQVARGSRRRQAGVEEAAQRYVQEFDASDPVLTVLWAHDCRDQKQFSRAATLYNQAQALYSAWGDPFDARLCQGMGEMTTGENDSAAKNYESARTHFETAAHTFPGPGLQAQAYFALGESLLELHDYAASREAFTESSRLYDQVQNGLMRDKAAQAAAQAEAEGQK